MTADASGAGGAGASYRDLFDAHDHNLGGGATRPGHQADHAAHDAEVGAPASDCAYCPFCRAIGVARATHPEAMDHLATAARELMTAAALFLERAGRAPEAETSGAPAEPGARAEPGAGPPSRFRRIDIG
ncbi:MAG: hypothetical protein ABR575_11455 [Actinomycetota bacterium]